MWKCKQSRPGWELWFLNLFPVTLTITPQKTSKNFQRLKSYSDDVISAVYDFLTNWMHILYHQRKKYGDCNFWLSSHHLILCQTSYPYLVVSGCQLSPFLFFIPRSHLTAFPFESPSGNQNSLSIRCWYVSIFNPRVPYYFTIAGVIRRFIPFLKGISSKVNVIPQLFEHAYFGAVVQHF